MKFTDSEINCLDVGIAAQNDEIKRLRAFAREILDRDRGDDIGGDELQALGEKYELLVAHFPKEPCGEDCACLGYYERRDFLLGHAMCYRLADSLKVSE